ncbi:MAG: carboxypeptidase-like regulatory domain-containing protein [Longimicrobiales bacterium]
MTCRKTLSLALGACLLSGTALLGQTPDGATGTVVGMVYDSTASAPLAGARVAVMGTQSTGETDERGEFRLDEVPTGSHFVTFFHPRLGELGVGGNQQSIDVRDGRISEVVLTVPSRETIVGAWCSAEEGEGDTSVGGIITDVVTGVPLPGVAIGVAGERTGVLQRRRLVTQTRTGNAGEYRLCNMDSSENLIVQAVYGENQADPVAVVRPGLQIIDIAMRISEPVTITGTVLDHATRAPLVGAVVSLVGTRFSSTTDTIGAFGLTNVPPGRQIIQVDQIGYAPRTDSLTVFSEEALGLEIVLATEAIVLDPIVVTGRSRGLDILTTPGTRFSGMTEAQVDSVRARIFDFPSLARAAKVPGLQITERAMAGGFGGPQMGVCIQMTRARSSSGGNTCNMVYVLINDAPVPEPQQFLLQMNPQDVARMQFMTPLEAGMLYGDRGNNGVLLLYTR